MESFFIIHDFHNGEQLGKNGSEASDGPTKQTWPRQQRRARCFSFLFKKLAKQVQNQIFSGHLSPLSRLL